MEGVQGTGSHIDDTTTTNLQGTMCITAGNTNSPTRSSTIGPVLNPTLAPGIKCYVDASTAPDHEPTISRTAGIGIFFVNPQVQPVHTIYIRAQMTQTLSVLMAEAAAMALAATLAEQLHYDNVTFLFDCQQLVDFLSSPDRNNPPEWQITYYTQVFVNSTASHHAKIYKISRDLNTTADNLAKQASSATVPSTANLSHTCSNMAHISRCPLVDALHNLKINSVILLAASCC